MTQSSAIGLSAQEVARVFPFHLGFDEHLRLVQLGPSLNKLAPQVALGQLLTDHFAFELPHVRAFAGLCRGLDVPAVLRVLHSGALLRGQLVLSAEPRRLLYLGSPHLAAPDDLSKIGLELTDFAPHETKAELLHALQAQESSLADVRKLMSKLAAQRREERATLARLTALHELTRILGNAAEARRIEEVGERVLAQLAAIVRFPVVSLYLQDQRRQLVHVVPGASADRCALLLAERLAATAPDVLTSAWQPIAGAAAHRFSLEYASSERSRLASALGFTSAYRQRIDGLSGSVGVIEIYAPEGQPRESLVLDGLDEVALRIAEFIDRSRTDAALHGSIEIAANAATAKSQLLGRLSEELHAPVEAALGLVEQVLRGELAAGQRHMLEAARAAGERVLDRLSDVLDYSRMESGQLELAELTFDLHGCLRRVQNLFGARAAAKHLSLGLIIDPHIPELVRGDELRLSQVLVCLIGNAIKFTKAGSVQVTAQLIGDHAGVVTIELVVRDTGIGIGSSRRELILSPLAGLSAGGPGVGLGLGLAITRQLVELMGGELTVASEPGAGSLFRFSVVLVRAEPERPDRATLASSELEERREEAERREREAGATLPI